MSVGIPSGNVKAMGVVSVVFDVASLSANTTEEQTVTVKGLKTTDFVSVSKPSHDTGAMAGTARVSADNTLAVTFMNATGSAIDPGSETYMVYWARPEGVVSAAKE